MQLFTFVDWKEFCLHKFLGFFVYSCFLWHRAYTKLCNFAHTQVKSRKMRDWKPTQLLLLQLISCFSIKFLSTWIYLYHGEYFSIAQFKAYTREFSFPWCLTLSPVIQFMLSAFLQFAFHASFTSIVGLILSSIILWIFESS